MLCDLWAGLAFWKPPSWSLEALHSPVTRSWARPDGISVGRGRATPLIPLQSTGFVDGGQDQAGSGHFTVGSTHTWPVWELLPACGNAWWPLQESFEMGVGCHLGEPVPWVLFMGRGTCISE